METLTFSPSARFNRRQALPLGRVGIRNVRLQTVLERVAAKFNEAEVPLLVMKGCALMLDLYKLDDRPMDDIDLLIHPEHLPMARRLLHEIGASPGRALPTNDFCPRFYYETEFRMGDVYPVKIDLHVRPFRPLRCSRLVPPDALWARARQLSLGGATILVPGTEDMLIHLAVHAAYHGCSRRVWLQDIKLWSESHQAELDWALVLATIEQWGVALPFRKGLECAEQEYGPICPPRFRNRLSSMSASWRDRLALWQAPRDAAHPLAHVLVNFLCTPGLGFTLAYVRAVVRGSLQKSGA